MKNSRVRLMMALLILCTAGPAFSQAGYRVIAKSGGAVPDTPGTTFGSNFQSMQIHPAGPMTFYGQMSGDQIGDLSPFGLFTVEGGSSRLLLRSGDPAPGLEGVNIRFPNSIGFAASGDYLFSAYLSGAGVDASNDEAIWLRSGQTTTLVARTGAPAPGTENGTVFGHLEDPMIDLAGNVLFEAGLSGPAVNTTNAQAIFSGSPSSLHPLARTGSIVPGVGTLTFLQSPARLSAQGQVAFTAYVDADLQDMPTQLFYGNVQQVQPVLSMGTHAPGTADGVNFKYVYIDSMNARGELLLSMDSVLTGPGVTDANDDGVWAGTPGNLKLVARSGDVALGTGGKRYNGVYDMDLDDEKPMFIGPRLGNGGHVNLVARLTDADGNLIPEWGAWAGKPGQLEKQDFNAVSTINAAGQFLSIISLYQDPDTVGMVLLAADLDGGQQSILHTGQVLDLGDGDLRTVYTFAYQPGLMALSDDGQVLMQVTFTDLSSAVILVTIPEPSIASGLMIAAAIGLLMRRKRVS